MERMHQKISPQFEDFSRIVVFDLETTGFNPYKNEPIEFAAVVLKKQPTGFEIVETINEFIQAKTPLPDKIKALTNITDAQVESGITQEKLADIIARWFTDDALIVAYNILFDMGFVDAVMKKNRPDFCFEGAMLDVMCVYKDRHAYPHRLENAVDTYRVDIPNSHRAIDDTRALAAVLMKMHEEEDVALYINSLGYNPKYTPPRKRYRHIDYFPQAHQKYDLKEKILARRRTLFNDPL